MNYYNSSSNYYDEISNEFQDISQKRKLYLKAIDQEIIKIIKLKKPKYILDIGTADGIRLKNLLKSFDFIERIDCLEPSKKMFNICKKNKFNSKYFSFYNKSIENYNSIKKYDLILALWSVFVHSENPILFLENSKKCLSNEGEIILDVNNRFNIKNYGIFNFFKNLLSSLLKLPNNRFFKIKSKNTSTKVQLFNTQEMKNLLKSTKLLNFRFQYFNYNNGKVANRFTGQMFIRASKK